jgi:hypothetical protein
MEGRRETRSRVFRATRVFSFRSFRSALELARAARTEVQESIATFQRATNFTGIDVQGLASKSSGLQVTLAAAAIYLGTQCLTDRAQGAELFRLLQTVTVHS